ncbi:unnamed protein product [Rhizophagus irregularis]|uniref:Arrestin C-terminal-like domain-containing protein n=1 Tax=Rhizophagus irregularis TaxID=588596 RepID=A0A916EK58_9GLOM|nr:unnamed protein product [Rhizophagus irregularis]CAB5205775.1 unnamed protein product [Rhizophagus irregularis]CAB5389477.1 unnamed protein product [Rhizophagus irregularis]
MNNSIIAVDILPDDDGKVMMYGAPNKDTTYLVSGKLRIILSKPLKTKLISIKLKGKSEYSDWENQYSCIYLLKLEKVLREKTTLPSGVTDLDFEFQVNGNIPQSYVTSFGLIRYNLVATVQPSSLLLKQGRAEKSINISRHYLPCRRELLPAPPTKVYRGQRKNILKYELDIPTVICINETSLLIRLRLFPLCNQGRVKKVAFDLIQSEKYRIQPTPQDYQEFSIENAQLIGNVQLNNNTSAKRKRSHPIKPTSLKIIYDQDTWENPLTYNLPFEQYSTRNINNPIKKTKLKATIKSPLMRVRHKLKITMTFEALEEKTLELGFPITVTTLPDGVISRPITPSDHSETHSRSSTPNLYEDVGSGDSNISRPVTPTPPPPFSDESTINLNTHTSHTTTNTSNTALTSNTSHTSHTINNTSHTSHITNTTILSSSPPDSQLLSQPQPQLNKKKSQRSLAQALGRLLLRSESSSRPNSPSPSASTTPTVLTPVTSSYPNNNNRSRTHPQLEVTPSSSPTFAPHNQPTSSTNSTNNIVYQGIGNLYTRTGRASWYLNMPDDDDAPTLTPEIHSAPSSPRESLVHIPSSNNLLPPPNQQRRNKNNIPSDRMIHRRSISFDSSLTQSIINESSIPSGSSTTQTRSNNDNPSENSSISSLLRHPSINSLKGMVKRRKKPATIDDNTSRLAINRIDINITIPSPTLGTYNLN